MTITKTLARANNSFFFRNSTISICEEAAFLLAGIPDNRQQIARVTLATKNPKKKGFRKVICLQFSVLIGRKNITTTSTQSEFLANLNIQEGQSFWMKCEIA